MRILYSFLLMIVFVGCSGTKNLYKIEKQTIVTFKEAYYQEYVAGIRGGGSGTMIFLTQEVKESEKVELTGIYFQEKYSKLKSQGNNKYQGFIKGKANWKQDEVVLIGEKKKEEKIETIEETFPFQLDKDEAVVSFFYKGKLKYNKITLVRKELETLPQ